MSRVRVALPGLLTAVLLAGAGTAQAAGAWTTFLRAYHYADLLAEGDTVWCATGEAGLLRYDRAAGTLTSITREPGGLSSNLLSALARDRSRRLWVGTVGAGASRRSPDGATWDLLNRFDGLPSDTVTVLTAVGDTMWIGTTAGLALWNGRTVAGALPDGVNPSPFASDWITGIVQRGDSLWVATRQGAYVGRLSTGLSVWTLVNDGLAASSGWKALTTDGGVLIGLASGGGVFRRVPAAGNWANVSGSIGTTFRLSQDGTEVLASASTGLYRWNGSGWSLVNGALLSNTNDGTERAVYAAALDESGRAVGANVDGLAVEPDGGGLPWPVSVPPGPPGNEVLNMALQGSRVYVTTMVEGIGRYDGTEWRLWPPTPCVTCDTTFAIPLFPFALQPDRRGHKWFGMWQVGVDVLDDTSDPPQVVHNRYAPPPLDLRTNMWASAVDSIQGGVWFGMDTNCLGCAGRTPLGLLYYTRQGLDSLNLRQDSLPAMRGTKVHGLTVDRTGRIWVGFTGEGLQHFTWPPSGAPFDFLTVPGTENFDVQGLVARGDSIWVMTTREVIIYYRPTATAVGSFLLPSVPADLPLHPLAIGLDGTAYAGSTEGLRARKRDGTVVDYNVANSPISDNAVRVVRVHPVTGVVWIGTAAGLNRFDPGYRPPPPPPPPALNFVLFPNPVPTSALGVTLRIQGTAGPYSGVVVDLSGREVHRFGGVGNGGVIWDGRHQGGSRVRPGIYFVRVEAGGRSAVRRIVVIH